MSPRVRAQGTAALPLQASAFESYMRRARAIDASFSGPGDVAQALQTGAAHELAHELGSRDASPMPRMLPPCRSRGLRRRRAAPTMTAARWPAGLGLPTPQAALALPGGEAAGARASGALYAQGSALSDDGEKVKRASYSIQRQAWAKAKVSDPTGRLARVKHLSAIGYQPSRDDTALLQTALNEGGRRPGPPSPLVARGVALAALSVLGEDGAAHSLMSEPRTDSCLRLAKLNLYQCLASAGPHYEDVFCLGQHAMIDPGQCVVEATRAPMARQVAMSQAASYRR